jgi:hypothetical protein
MTPEVAQRIVQLRAPASTQRRMEALAAKSTAGTLTTAERDEYNACVSVGNFIAILQAKARILLDKRESH